MLKASISLSRSWRAVETSRKRRMTILATKPTIASTASWEMALQRAVSSELGSAAKSMMHPAQGNSCAKQDYCRTERPDVVCRPALTDFRQLAWPLFGGKKHSRSERSFEPLADVPVRY